MLWDCYGRVVAGKYLGQVEADTAEEAKEKALLLDACFVSVCHQCAREVEDPEIDEVSVEKAYVKRQSRS